VKEATVECLLYNASDSVIAHTTVIFAIFQHSAESAVENCFINFRDAEAT
jgi:hypothetical protein